MSTPDSPTPANAGSVSAGAETLEQVAARIGWPIEFLTARVVFRPSPEDTRKRLGVPTNAELGERAQSLDARTVVRNWLARHPTPDVGRDGWLDWAASNFLADPEIAQHLTATPPAVRTGEDDGADVLPTDADRSEAAVLLAKAILAGGKDGNANARALADAIAQALADQRAALSARPLVSGTANRDDVARELERHVVDPWLARCKCGKACNRPGTVTHPEHLADELLALLGGDQDDEDGAR